jgi:glycosyltransferase involved in cell wall biosynthesis
MRITFCWPEFSGYMGACWQALAKRPGVELFVIAFKPEALSAFSEDVLKGVPCRLLDPTERQDTQLIAQEVARQRPDVLFISGWFHPPYTALAHEPRLPSTRRVLTMDTIWRRNLRQRLTRFRLWRFLNAMDRAFVPGERSFQYALRLGFPPTHIHRGLYGCDFDRFSPVYDARRAAGDWPRAFLFMGRYIDIKAIDIMASAYQIYRNSVSDPWTLNCYGTGPFGRFLKDQPGILDGGFVQPASQPDVMVKAGALVLASRRDAWPLVILEACASGLPILCSEACGSIPEMIRPCYTGLTVATNDADALAYGMQRFHAWHDRLPQMGYGAREHARAYSAEAWADRVIEIAQAR